MNIWSKKLLMNSGETYEPNQVIINGSGTINLKQDGIYSLVCAGGRGGSGGGSWREDIISGSTPKEYNSVTIFGGNGGKFEGWIYLTKGTYTAVQGANGTSNSFYHITYSQSVYGTSGGDSYLQDSNGTYLVRCSGGSRGGLTITYNPNDGNYTSKTTVSMSQHHGQNGSAIVSSSAETYNTTTGTSSSPTFILTYIGTKEDVFAGGMPFTRPNLSANGTMGGSAFAVSASTADSSAKGPWRAVDGNTASYWQASVMNAYFYFYNPKPLCVTSITTSWGFKISYLKFTSPNLTVAGSNDNSTWTNISYTAQQGSTNKILQINLTNSNYYKYYRIYLTNTYGAFLLYELNIDAVEQVQ